MQICSINGWSTIQCDFIANFKLDKTPSVKSWSLIFVQSVFCRLSCAINKVWTFFGEYKIRVHALRVFMHLQDKSVLKKLKKIMLIKM